MHGLAAKWIWFDAGRETAVFARARRVFELGSVPKEVELKITCSGHYKLFVNGRYICRGPMRSHPSRKRYDFVDVSEELSPGSNVIAVALVHYGYATAQASGIIPGFWFQLDAGSERLESDLDWRFSWDPCFHRDAARRNSCYGPAEIFDARKEEDWTATSYDDSAWQKPYVVTDNHGNSGPFVNPMEKLVPRTVPMMHEEAVPPATVERIGEVIGQEDMIGTTHIPTLASYLLQDVVVDARFSAVENAAGVCEGGSGAAFVSQPSPKDYGQPNQVNAVIIYDFGREITGYGWLDVEGNEGAVVDISYGERLIAGRVQSVVQHVGYADRYILTQGRQRHEVYDWKGFRYMQLTFRNLTEPLKLHGVGATISWYPLEQLGSFTSPDKQVEEIWRTGAYTQQLCTHDTVMDCPWREQQQWLGDGRVQLLILQNAFGEKTMPRSFVENFAESQLATGHMRCVAPGCDRYIVDYSLWWVQALWDVLLFDGDVEFAARWILHLEKQMAWFDGYINADGLLERTPGWVFIDWANVGKDGVCAVLNAIYAIACDAAANVCRAAGRKDLMKTYTAKAAAVRNAFHGVFWDDGRRFYVDNVVDGAKSGRFSWHTQAAAVLAGVLEVDATDLMERAVGDSSLVKTEPYFSYYLCEALSEAGLGDKAMEFVRDRWGAMLDAGATSFWEEWQPAGSFREGYWRMRPRSQCHAWSAGPTAWISRRVLGVRVESLEDKLVVAPQPCGLQAVEGTVPTRFGPVHVKWRMLEGDLQLEVDAPDGCELLTPSPRK